MSVEHLVNVDLIKMAQAGIRGSRTKNAFVPGGDMAGMDPAAAAAGGGGDPAAAGGGMPPADPAAAGGGGGGFDPTSLQPMIQQMVQQAMQQGGGGMGMGGGAASGAPLKPKIDVNVEIMQIKNMLAKLCDAQGIVIPAQDMTATPEKLMAMAQGQSPASGAQVGGAGGAGGGAIGQVDPMQGMQGAGMPGAAPAGGGEKAGSYRNNGRSFDTSGIGDLTSRAAAISRIRGSRRARK